MAFYATSGVASRKNGCNDRKTGTIEKLQRLKNRKTTEGKWNATRQRSVASVFTSRRTKDENVTIPWTRRKKRNNGRGSQLGPHTEWSGRQTSNWFRHRRKLFLDFLLQFLIYLRLLDLALMREIVSGGVDKMQDNDVRRSTTQMTLIERLHKRL